MNGSNSFLKKFQSSNLNSCTLAKILRYLRKNRISWFHSEICLRCNKDFVLFGNKNQEYEIFNRIIKNS